MFFTPDFLKLILFIYPHALLADSDVVSDLHSDSVNALETHKCG